MPNTIPTQEAYDRLRRCGMPDLYGMGQAWYFEKKYSEAARDILTMHALRWLAAKIGVKDTCWLEVVMPEEEGEAVSLWRKIANGDNDPLALFPKISGADLLDAITLAAEATKGHE